MAFDSSLYQQLRPDLLSNWQRANDPAWIAANPGSQGVVDYIKSFPSLDEYLKQDYQNDPAGNDQKLAAINPPLQQENIFSTPPGSPLMAPTDIAEKPQAVLGEGNTSENTDSPGGIGWEGWDDTHSYKPTYDWTDQPIPPPVTYGDPANSIPINRDTSVVGSNPTNLIPVTSDPSIVGSLDRNGVPILTDGGGRVVNIDANGVRVEAAPPFDPNSPNLSSGGGIFGGGIFGGTGNRGNVIPLPVDPVTAIAASVLLSNGNIFGGGGSLAGTVNQVGNIARDPVGATGTALGNLGDNVMGPPNQGGPTTILPPISFPTGGNSSPTPETPPQVQNQAPTPTTEPGGGNIFITPTGGSSGSGQTTVNQPTPTTPGIEQVPPTTVIPVGGNSGPPTVQTGIFQTPTDKTPPQTQAVIPTPTPAPGPYPVVRPTDNAPQPQTVVPTPTPAPGPYPVVTNTDKTPPPPPTIVTPKPNGNGDAIPPPPPTIVTPTPTPTTGGTGTAITSLLPGLFQIPNNKGTTMPSDPTLRNYYNEGNQSTDDLSRLFPGMASLYGSASGQYGQNDFNNFQNILNQFGGQNQNLTGLANQQTIASNSALRSGNVNDAGQLGGQALGYLQALNPNMYGALNQAQAGAGNGIHSSQFQNQLGNTFGAGPQYSQVNPTTGYNRIEAQNGDVGLNYAGGQVGNIGPSAIQHLLEQQAQANLSLGGSLSAQDLNQAQQAARDAWGARGLVNSPGSVGAEILNTDALSRQRLAERQAAAQSIDAAGFGQRQQGFTDALGYSNAAQNYGQMGLTAQQANLGAQLQGNQLGYQGQLANQSAGLQAQQQNNSLGTNLLTQDYNRQNTNFGNILSNAQLQAQNQFNPFSQITNATTQNQGLNTNLFNQTGALSSGQLGNQYVQNAYNPYNPYSQDVYSTNSNASNASKIAAGNNAAALQGANTYANQQLVNSLLNGAFSGSSGLGGALTSVGGGLGSIFSGIGGLFGGSCWVARSVYGEDNPKWLLFRLWLMTRAPKWFRAFYIKHGEKFAAWLDKNSWLKPAIRVFMDSRIKTLNKSGIHHKYDAALGYEYNLKGGH